MQFNVNEGISDPKQKNFARPVILAVLLFGAAVILIIIFNGKHNRLGKDGIETNIPDTFKASPPVEVVKPDTAQSNVRAILNLNKYIDTNKLVYIKWGTNISRIDLAALRIGINPFQFAPFLPAGEGGFNIKLVNGELLVNFVVYGFDDKYIGKIVNNKLIAPNRNLEMYTSDHYLEIIDDYNVPALQIDLDRRDNSITVFGAFSTRFSYMVIGPDGVNASSFAGRDKRTLPDSMRQWLLSQFIDAGRKLKPLHEY